MTQQLQQAQYEGFFATRTHHHSNGLAIMPTAGPFPQPATVVALHGGLDYDIVVCQASRSGDVPQMPTPKITNPNRVFLSGGRWGQWPVQDMVGVKVYTVGVWYLFGILSPEGLTSNFYLGSLPFPGIDQNEFVPGSYFNYQLINQTLTQVLTPVPNKPNFLIGIAGAG